jgi:hypothetical protein
MAGLSNRATRTLATLAGLAALVWAGWRGAPYGRIPVLPTNADHVVVY